MSRTDVKRTLRTAAAWVSQLVETVIDCQNGPDKTDCDALSNVAPFARNVLEDF